MAKWRPKHNKLFSVISRICISAENNTQSAIIYHLSFFFLLQSKILTCKMHTRQNVKVFAFQPILRGFGETGD